ncbi:MAG: GH92 family glycosyl hydrolase [Terriglobales bacterium]
MARLRTPLSFVLLFLAPAMLLAQTPARTPVDWVNPYIGTAGVGSDYGGTMPLVTTPFGMTNWTAQTRQNFISASSYNYGDTTISGFIGTHQPAIWMGDFGYVTLIPELGDIKTSPEDRKLKFTHAGEQTTPYYYSVNMDAGESQRVRAEITATDHCGYLRFTFTPNSRASVLVEATRAKVSGSIQVDAHAREITGFNPDRMDAHLGPFALPNFKGYFVVQFREPFAASGTYEGPALHPSSASATGQNVGAYATFSTPQQRAIEVRIGTSFISIDQARNNLTREIPEWDFDQTRDRLKQTWDQKLGLIEIEGASDEQRAIFYTGLYHALLYPRLFSEFGKYYSAFDDRVHDGISYTAYSLWDTFRAEHSLLTLVAPERVNDMVKALLQNYREGGWMPKWPNPSYTNIMIATHADAMVAEAINKGFRGFDLNIAYKAAYKDAMTPPDGDTTRKWLDREPHTPYEARAGLTYAKKLGYVPADKASESASSTLEDAYDDYAVAQIAKAAGQESDYRFFMNRSLNYKLLFNPKTGFMQARNSDGSWADPAAGWTEGDKWVYTWSVMHDLPGLMQLMGGADTYNRKLDEHFAGGHNHHDNEPSHHYGYLYDYSGEPWKTQQKVRQIAAEAYSNTPTGILGNEDCGQMSAWYIFTAVGFYPVNPVSGDYMIGSPIFEKTTLHLPNGKTFVISAPESSATNLYIQSAKLNGKPLDIPMINYADIQRGGTLSFTMGASPSKWGSNWHPGALPSYAPSDSR